eukprot:5153919-Alexandrium_andersonii.AAC.1
MGQHTVTWTYVVKQQETRLRVMRHSVIKHAKACESMIKQDHSGGVRRSQTQAERVSMQDTDMQQQNMVRAEHGPVDTTGV